MSHWARHDVGLYVAAAGTSVVGSLLVWSATSRTDGTAYLVRHLVTAAVGLGLALLVSRVGQHRVRPAAPWVCASSVLLLLAVLTPVGRTVNGSRFWIPLLAGFTVQPGRAGQGGALPGPGHPARRAGRARAGARASRGGARGSAHRAADRPHPAAARPGVRRRSCSPWGRSWSRSQGVPRRRVVAAVLLGLAAAVLALTTPVLSDYQRDRFTSFVDPSADPQGSGYQTRMVLLAIGAGGMWGQGFLRGERTQGGSVPHQLNDFVFSVAGEELGFVGATGLLLLLAFVVGRVLVVAARATDGFGRLVAVGVATRLAVQVVQNVGMNLGLLPVTSLPLRFVSCGGSSMVVSWLAVGLSMRHSRWRLAGNKAYPSGRVL